MFKWRRSIIKVFCKFVSITFYYLYVKREIKQVQALVSAIIYSNKGVN